MKKIITGITFATLMSSTAVFAQTTAPATSDMPSSRPSVTSPSTTAPSTTTPSATMPSTPSTAMPSTSASTTTMSNDGMTLTEDQAKNWIGKSVYSADNKNLGSVGEIKRDAAGKVTDLTANIGGFLGLGQSHVRVLPSQFKMDGEKIVLTLPADQAKSLPVVDAAVTPPAATTTRPAPKN